LRSGSGVGDSMVAGTTACRSTAGRSAAPILAALLLCACQTPTQRIPLDLEPASLSVFVDGVELSGTPGELVLRSDRAHVLFFRKQGYAPQRLVLRSGVREGEPYLMPPEVQVRLAPAVPSDHELTIEPATP